MAQRIWMLAILTVCFGASVTRGAADRPNVLLILIDNVGYCNLGCYGNAEVKTPNMDRLAGEGVRCTDFYAFPSCTPSRGAILTGRCPQRNGLNWQLNAEQNIRGYGLPLSEKLIPQYLKPLGYATAAFGKWNLGFAPGARPTERGFDEFLGHASGNIGYFKHLYAGQNDMRLGTEPVDLDGQYSTDLFADAAIDFIGRHKQQQWFVYLPFNAAHFVSGQNVAKGEKIEWQVPEKYLAMYGCKADEPDQKKRFYAVMTALDDAIGRVLAAVDADHTLVFCISDNGAFMLPGRGLEVQSNRPLRNGGVTTYEGGIRVPAIIRWPGKVKAGSVSPAVLSTLDIMPTVVKVAGGELPADRVIDGMDAMPALSGQTAASHPFLCWTWKEGKDHAWAAIRAGDWKLVRPADEAPWQLYELSKDVGETNDVANAQPARVRELADTFNRWSHDISTDPTRGILK